MLDRSFRTLPPLRPVYHAARRVRAGALLMMAMFAFLAAPLAGCGSIPGDRASHYSSSAFGGATSGGDVILLGPEPGRADEVRRLLPGINAGLELHRMVIAWPFEHVERTLRPFALSDPLIDDEERAALQDHGLLVVSVPMSQLSETLAQLHYEPMVDSSWMGQVTDWTPVAEGQWIGGTTRFDIAGESLPFADGRFRLLVRSYVMRVETGAIVRVEMVPQFHQPQPDPFIRNPVMVNLMGQYVADAALALSLDGGRALLITATSPGSDIIPTTNSGPAADDENNNNDDDNDGGGEVSSTDGESASSDSSGNGAAGDQRDVDDADLDVIDEAPPGATRQIIRPQGPRGGHIQTPGEAILESPDSLRRELLVFVPRL